MFTKDVRAHFFCSRALHASTVAACPIEGYTRPSIMTHAARELYVHRGAAV
jgi:hypothetical protein